MQSSEKWEADVKKKFQGEMQIFLICKQDYDSKHARKLFKCVLIWGYILVIIVQDRWFYVIMNTWFIVAFKMYSLILYRAPFKNKLYYKGEQYMPVLELQNRFTICLGYFVSQPI